MPVYDLEPIEEVGGNTSEEVPKESISDRLTGAESLIEKKPEVAKENSYEKILERVQAQTSTPTTVTSQQSSTVKGDVATVADMDEESKIQKLVNIAIEKGPEHAIRVAVQLDDMYALDILHDRLSHQLYEELLAKGLLKET